MINIDDIGEVIRDVTIEDCRRAKVLKGEIIAVVGLDEYRGYVNCGAKVSEMANMLADCSKCRTKMKISKCHRQSVANIVVKDTEGKDHRVTVFDGVLQQIRDFGKKVQVTIPAHMSNCY